jgi:hypothetical protein
VSHQAVSVLVSLSIPALQQLLSLTRRVRHQAVPVTLNTVASDSSGSGFRSKNYKGHTASQAYPAILKF